MQEKAISKFIDEIKRINNDIFPQGIRLDIGDFNFFISINSYGSICININNKDMIYTSIKLLYISLLNCLILNYNRFSDHEKIKVKSLMKKLINLL